MMTGRVVFFIESTNMNSNSFLVPVILAWLSLAGVSLAEESVKEPVEAEVKQDLSKEVMGYWVVDFDSAETKAFIADLSEGGDAADSEKEMGAATFEFKPEQMVMHGSDGKRLVKIAVKSQDIEKKILVADFQADEDDETVLTTLQINGDRLILSRKEPAGENVSLGLERIDEDTFKKRVPEVDKNEEAEAAPEKEVMEFKDGYPVATPVPDKAGYVYSPYNKSVVDVRDLPSGMLVADPNFPSDEKKFFRVP